MKLIPYILYLLLITIYEVILRDVISVYGIGINLVAFLVLAMAIYKSEVISMWFGFSAGLVLATGMSGITGWCAFFTAALGLVAYQTWGRLNLDSLYSKLLVIFVGTVVHSAILVSLGGFDGYLNLLGTNVLPGAVYTTILAYLFFLVVEGRLTYKKIQSLF